MDFFAYKKKYKWFVAVVLLLIFLNIIGFSSWGQRAVFKIIYPGSIFIRDISQGFILEDKSKSELLEENLILQVENEKYESRIASLIFLEEENERLRQHLNFLQEKSLNYVLANVVWQENLLNFSHYNQNMIIDRGSIDGIRKGLAVLNESGVVVGKIIDASEKNSQACLINNTFCKMAVSVDNSSRSIGVAEGDLGLSIQVNFVSQSEEINIGDRIISSGLEQDIPAGLAVGRVIRVEKDVNDIWQQVNAEPFFRVNNLSIVSVVIPERYD